MSRGAAPAPASGQWDSFGRVQELVRVGVLSGAALLAPHGACLFAAGSLEHEFVCDGGDCDAETAAHAEQFVRPFLDADAEVLSLTLRGAADKLVVIQRDARSLHAVSRRRAAGVCVTALPCGTLVAAYERGAHGPRAVAQAVEAAVEALR